MKMGEREMKNMGKTDRIIRVILGVALLSLFFVLSGWLKLLGLLGVILLVTSAVGVCPLYMPFRINTNKKAK
jgi:hypothetical protein